MQTVIDTQSESASGSQQTNPRYLYFTNTLTTPVIPPNAVVSMITEIQTALETTGVSKEEFETVSCIAYPNS